MKGTFTRRFVLRHAHEVGGEIGEFAAAGRILMRLFFQQLADQTRHRAQKVVGVFGTLLQYVRRHTILLYHVFCGIN